MFRRQSGAVVCRTTGNSWLWIHRPSPRELYMFCRGSQRQLKKHFWIMCPMFSELPNVRLRVLLVLDPVDISHWRYYVTQLGLLNHKHKRQANVLKNRIKAKNLWAWQLLAKIIQLPAVKVCDFVLLTAGGSSLRSWLCCWETKNTAWVSSGWIQAVFSSVVQQKCFEIATNSCLQVSSSE